MTTERELIQRLADALHDAAEDVEGWGNYASIYFQEKHDLSGNVAKIHALAKEARAYLAQAEPEDKVLARVEFAKGDFNGPFDVILAQYCDDWFYGDPERTEVDPVDLCRGAIKLFAQVYALPIPPSTETP